MSFTPVKGGGMVMDNPKNKVTHGFVNVGFLDYNMVWSCEYLHLHCREKLRSQIFCKFCVICFSKWFVLFFIL
jgi:hypothetical protein